MIDLAGECTTLALCWRVERRDGVTIGLTAHDRDLTVDGLVHRAAPGMVPSAVRRSDGLEPDTMDVHGALASDAIGEADLLAGRWDGARVTLFAVDWQVPEAGQLVLGSGTIGAVETRDGHFTAELAGGAAALDAPVAEATSPGCRAELGDARCRVPMAGRRRLARVTGVAERSVTLDLAEPEAGAWSGGRLRWLTGPNSGLEDDVAAADGATLTVRRPPRFDGTGACVEIVEGCDKRFETCMARFANAVNFQGEPHLPGIDLLTRFPGG